MRRTTGTCAALLLALTVLASPAFGFGRDFWPENAGGMPRRAPLASWVVAISPGFGVPVTSSILKTLISNEFPREIDTNLGGPCETIPFAMADTVEGWRNYEYGVFLYCPYFAEYTLKRFMEYQRRKHGADGVNPYIAGVVAGMNRFTGTDLDLIPSEPLLPWYSLDRQTQRDYEAYILEQVEYVRRKMTRHFKAVANGLKGKGW